jgi:stage II sporulation protein D
MLRCIASQAIERGRSALLCGVCLALVGFATSCSDRVELPPPPGGVPDIRVLLSDKLSHTQLAVPGPFRLLLLGDGDEPRLILEGEALESQAVRCIGGDLLVGDIIRTPLPVRVEPEGVALLLGGHHYRGSLVLIAHQDAIHVVNILDVEGYLRGVVPVESYPNWPVEALKAQAVAARSYALDRMAKRKAWAYDVRATTADQRYGGLSVEHESTNTAVEASFGQVLIYGGELIAAYYHSCCGGRTADPRLELNDATSPLRSTKCGYCNKAPVYQWKASASLADLAAAVGVPDLKGLALENIGLDGRVGRVLLHRSGGRAQALTGQEFRVRLVRKKINLRSTRFKVSGERNRFVFEGQGFGHGVGLCQWGAKGMADEGHPYKVILGHYYRDCKLRKEY